MLARNNNLNQALKGQKDANENNEDFDDGNIDDIDEGNISADANMNNLRSMNRDENGLPISMSKNVGKLPPLSNAP